MFPLPRDQWQVEKQVIFLWRLSILKPFYNFQASLNHLIFIKLVHIWSANTDTEILASKTHNKHKLPNCFFKSEPVNFFWSFTRSLAHMAQQRKTVAKEFCFHVFQGNQAYPLHYPRKCKIICKTYILLGGIDVVSWETKDSSSLIFLWQSTYSTRPFPTQPHIP